MGRYSVEKMRAQGATMKKRSNRKRSIDSITKSSSRIQIQQVRQRIAIYNHIATQENRDLDNTIRYLDMYIAKIHEE